MALTQEEEDKLKSELAATQQQVKDLTAKLKTDEAAVKEAEAKRGKDKPGKVELDPDIVKELATLKEKVASLEGKLSTGKKGGGGMLNFFGND